MKGKTAIKRKKKGENVGSPGSKGWSENLSRKVAYLDAIWAKAAESN